MLMIIPASHARRHALSHTIIAVTYAVLEHRTPSLLLTFSHQTEMVMPAERVPQNDGELGGTFHRGAASLYFATWRKGKRNGVTHTHNILIAIRTSGPIELDIRGAKKQQRLRFYLFQRNLYHFLFSCMISQDVSGSFLNTELKKGHQRLSNSKRTVSKGFTSTGVPSPTLHFHLNACDCD